MIEVAIMVEGQNGLNWANWQRLARAVEDLGFAGLYRSDHYTNANPPDKDSLELWISLAWLASHTRRIQFGPLVSPVSFRHPTMTARMAAAVDDLSGGRLVLGLGAGWQEREHTNYGWDLLDMDRRFARFEEGLEVITRLLHSDVPIDYSGSFYTIKEGILLPRPSRPGGPPILIGGNGQRRTLPLVARYAAEWNAVYILPDEFSRLSAELDVLVQQHGREPRQVRRSLMTGGVLGRDRAEVKRKVEARTQGKRTAEDLRQHGVIVGTPAEFREQLAVLEQSGVQRVMLQWLDLDDLVGLEALAKAIRVE
jgi:F420-dependent oxidoreductase-like protein